MSRPDRAPQARYLVRAAGLAAFRQALVERATEGRPLDARRRLVVVPTRAAADELRHTIEGRLLEPFRESDSRNGSGRALILPDLVTRDEWLHALHQALPGAPPLLSRVAREVLLARAGREAAARTRMGGAPFDLRPGLIGELLRFLDELLLRQRTVRRFARVLFDELRVERGTDRGSEGLIHQAAFMGFTFLAYERGVARSGGMDEHALRRRLLAEQPALPFDHIVVAVADRPSDPCGLWPADFDLLGRLRRCARIDVVMTEEAHDAGLRARLEEELPGIEEVRQPPAGHRPALITTPRAAASEPGEEAAAPPCIVSRDREEELRDVVRRIRARAAGDPAANVGRVAVVFQRPLPYLYLAAQVFADARVPYRALDALPLASEPFAALVDLVLAMARTGGTREATVAILRSPLLDLGVDRGDAAALEHVLAARQTTTDATAYVDEVEAWGAGRSTRERVDIARARKAAAAAAAVAAELGAFRALHSASAQVGAITRFIRDHERVVSGTDAWRRARAAVLGAIDSLADAYARHDDAARHPEALSAGIHHVLEAQTFAPQAIDGGVHVVDAVAARFGRFDHLHLVGLVETDWPPRSRRSIFFTSPLLTSLGWPQEREHTQAELAAFHDLVASAAETVTLHAFQLEGDAVVALSPLVRAVRGLTVEAHAPPPVARTFADEILTGSGVAPGRLAAPESAWLALRLARPPLDDPRYRGAVDAREPASYKVTAVDGYVQCPFKYFASTVLRLPEERDDVAGLTPLERGTMLHGLLERFYQTWQRDQGGTITMARLPEALALFTALAHEVLSRLPPADRALETDRLLGSIAAPGVADRVFEHEASAGGRIVDRVIEQPLTGVFDFPLLNGLSVRPVDIRGKADRIDVFDDGSLRVVDYKLSRPPDKDSVQIAVYALCAQQALQRRDTRPHAIRDAAYLAFAGDDLATPLAKDPGGTEAEVVKRTQEFANAVQRIEAGEFPPRPKRFDLCQWCPYAGVCRKEYRMGPEEA